MLKWLKILPPCQSVVCLDGSLPYRWIQKLNLPIIAADGAANKLLRHHIEPQMILGDLDSVDESLLYGRKYLKISDQDTTDFEKVLGYAERESLTPTLVTGIDGGSIDHMLGNVSILARTRSLFLTKNIIGMVLDGNYQFDKIPLHTKISIFGMPHCRVQSKGLRWELNSVELSVGGEISLGNRARSSEIELKVLSGKAMVCIYRNAVRDAGLSSSLN
jgi:thiamine pyrophosphokinase